MPVPFARGRGAALMLVLFMLMPTAALAHERRDVGKLQFVVGWSAEPALLGEPNGLELRIADKATGNPVEGAEKTLKASIAFGGGQPKELPLRARFGQKGAYHADVVPTRAGSYVFTFSGTVGDQTVKEKFESGPGRFDDVKPLADVQFPQTVPYAGEMAAQLQAADAKASQAAAFGYVGTGLGLLGLVVGSAAFVRRARGA